MRSTSLLAIVLPDGRVFNHERGRHRPFWFSSIEEWFDHPATRALHAERCDAFRQAKEDEERPDYDDPPPDQLSTH